VRVALVTGSRHWTDPTPIYNTLNEERPDLVIEGGASGADLWARQWAKANGKAILTWPDEHWGGHLTGPARNQHMVSVVVALERAGWETVVLAFPGSTSRGTWSCVRQAQKAGLAMRIADQQVDVSTGTRL
jgi:hypothetical protein